MIVEIGLLMHTSNTIKKFVIHSSNIKTYTDIHEKDHGCPKSIIDYIITRQRAVFKVKDARVKRGLNCESDH